MSEVTPYRSQVAPVLFPRWLAWLIVALVLFAAASIRLRLLNLPLERDEGEYAYAGQLMLQGISPYQLAYNMKLPGTYAAYAAIMAAFGQTIRGIHIGLILVNSITILLVYLLGRRLFGSICGVVAAACFALLSLSNSVLGLAAHATHFVTLFAVAGTLVLLKAVEGNRALTLFWSGLLFGFAFLMKQTGVFFGLFGGLFLLWVELSQRPLNWATSSKRLGLYIAGALLPFLITCLLLVHGAVFGRFWFWTFSYARQYATTQSLSDGWLEFKLNALPIVHAAPGIFLLAAFGIALAFSVAEKRRAALFALVLCLASFATVCPGLYFRGHYFITLLPAIGLLAGAGFQTICDKIACRRHREFWLAIPMVALLAASGHTLFLHRALFFRLSPDAAARAIYGLNPFPESLEIGRYIRDHSSPDSRIAVLGSEPQIYFYSGRHSATGYIYTYGLMESHKYALTMQREMISEIEAAAPEFLVFVRVSFSWLEQKDSNRLVLEWADQYARSNYRAVGLVDIESVDRTVYRWDEKGFVATPRSEYFVWIFKRNDRL